MKVFVASLMLLISTFSWASEERVFLQDKPADCMSAIESALTKRGWKISYIDKSRVTASTYRSGKAIAARIDIFYREGGFYYTAEAKRSVSNTNGFTPFSQVDADMPEAWVEDLKEDTKLCQISDSSAPVKEGKDVRSRLEELNNLRKEGLISDDEYKDLRKKILESI